MVGRFAEMRTHKDSEVGYCGGRCNRNERYISCPDVCSFLFFPRLKLSVLGAREAEGYSPGHESG